MNFVTTFLEEILVQDGYCTTIDEAKVIVDTIMIDIIDTTTCSSNNDNNSSSSSTTTDVETTIKTNKQQLNNDNSNDNDNNDNNTVALSFSNMNMVLNESRIRKLLCQYLQVYLDIVESISISIVQECFNRIQQQKSYLLPEDYTHNKNPDETVKNTTGTDDTINDFDCSSDSDDDNDSTTGDSTDNDTDSDSDDEYVNGNTITSCDICDRNNIKLTRHHLIPKDTYKKVIQRLCQEVIRTMNNEYNTNTNTNNDDLSTTINNNNDNIDTTTTMESCFDHIIPIIIYETNDRCNNLKTNNTSQNNITNKKTTGKEQDMLKYKMIKQIVLNVIKQQTCTVCRPCHTMIHKTYTNTILAYNYNTVDKLLQDPTILKYAKWCNKQKIKGHYHSTRNISRIIKR